jgi:hypothetical protein
MKKRKREMKGRKDRYRKKEKLMKEINRKESKKEIERTKGREKLKK